jgi:hypothetical protein
MYSDQQTPDPVSQVSQVRISVHDDGGYPRCVEH